MILLIAKVLITVGLLLWLSRMLKRQTARGSSQARQQRLDQVRVLTRDMLESISDKQLVKAVHDHVWATLEAGDTAKRNDDTEIVSRLPKSMQYVWATWTVEGEVANGGFGQLFSNSSRHLVPQAVQGYRAFGVTKLAQALGKALRVYDKAVPKQIKAASSMDVWDWYAEHSEVDQQITACEAEFEVTPEDDRARERYIRTHLDEFVSNTSAMSQ